MANYSGIAQITILDTKSTRVLAPRGLVIIDHTHHPADGFEESQSPRPGSWVTGH